ncbi:MAG: hypothetical protein LBJ11_02000 [Oscillospiraceae bacterium]|jgi:hypothetical protein|nr:hypothetical protein [Oscillospiraceae bacterium]
MISALFRMFLSLLLSAFSLANEPAAAEPLAAEPAPVSSSVREFLLTWETETAPLRYASLYPQEEAPIPVRTMTDLDRIRENLSGHYVLTDDIVFYGKAFVPIGSLDQPFTGTLDGNGFAIRGLKISAAVSDGAAVGLFAENAGTLRNLWLEDCAVSVSVSASQGEVCAVGSLAGRNVGQIEACYVTGTVSLSERDSAQALEFRVGGLAGEISGAGAAIRKCTNLASVSLQCESAFMAYAGGICGVSEYDSAVLADCENLGTVSAQGNTHTYAGGLLGYTVSSAAISRGANRGAVSAVSAQGNARAGGIAGYLFSSTVTDCGSYAPVSASVSAANRSAQAGGLAGSAGGSALSYSFAYATASVSGGNASSVRGALVGASSGGTAASVCFFLTGIAPAPAGSGTLTATARTEEECSLRANFPGLDFLSVWQMISLPGFSGDLPYPKTLLSPPVRVLPPEPEPPFLRAGQEGIVVDRTFHYIYGIPMGTTQGELAQTLLEVVGNGKVLFVGENYDALVGTNLTVLFVVNDATLTILETYQVILFGDADENGIINSRDYNAMKAMVSGAPFDAMQGFAMNLEGRPSLAPSSGGLAMLKAFVNGGPALDQQGIASRVRAYTGA